MIFAVSCSAPNILQASQLQAGCLASAKGLARLASWWSIPAPRVEYTTDIGAGLDDPDAYDVHVLPDLSSVGGDTRDLAFHCVVAGRPTCYVGANVCKAENGTDNWFMGPNGLWAALDHELKECTIDPTCALIVQGPTCLEPKEVADRLQGTDYCEPGSEGIYLANAYGPEGLTLGDVRALGLDIASDLRAPTTTTAFYLAPGGYYQNATTGEMIFGDKVHPLKRERLLRTGPRGGMRKVAA
jgi:hypothetical protein